MDGKEVASLKGHIDTVNSCCFTPDDRKVISCSSDGTVKVEFYLSLVFNISYTQLISLNKCFGY